MMKSPYVFIASGTATRVGKDAGLVGGPFIGSHGKVKVESFPQGKQQ
jgi:hypothetical protein